MRYFTALTAAAVVALSGIALAGGGGGDSKQGASAAAPKNIVETAVAAGSFNTLAAALKAGGLVEALSGKGPFTVFAPTDEAFAKLPAGTLEMLLKPENKEKLVSILKFHVIAGEAPASEVVKMSQSSPTLQGQTFEIRTKDGKVMIGNEKAMANVVKTDIKCTNGIIHVIDTVIMPK